MAVIPRNDDALEVEADALLLTVDGTDPRSRGNITMSFARRWPGVLERAGIPIPIALGDARAVALPTEPACPFSCVVFASTLHHTPDVSAGQYLRNVRAALTSGVGAVYSLGARSMSCALMRGGWRAQGIRHTQVFDTMIAGFRAAARRAEGFDLHVCILDDDVWRAVSDHWRRAYLSR